MSNLVAGNDEKPSSSNMTQLNHPVAAIESHNASSEESSAEISTQAKAGTQADPQHIENDTASISEAAQSSTDEQSTRRHVGEPHSAGTDLSCPPFGLQGGSTDTINRSLRCNCVTSQLEQTDTATEEPLLP